MKNPKEKLMNKKHIPSVRNKISTAGITLVALVVTIVVLIILAAISINIIFTEGGILERTRQAKQDYADAQVNETHLLSDTANEIDSLASSRNPNTITPPYNGTEYIFAAGNTNGFTYTDGEIINHSLGLTYGTFSDEKSGIYNIAKCEKEIDIELDSQFEISASIQFNNFTATYMGGIKINFLKDDNILGSITLTDAWGSSSNSQYVGHSFAINNQTISSKSSLSSSSTSPIFTNNASGRFAIVGDGQKAYAYFGNRLLGSIDYSEESLSFDKITINFSKYSSYTVPEIYLESLYIGEPYYYKSFVETN